MSKNLRLVKLKGGGNTLTMFLSFGVNVGEFVPVSRKLAARHRDENPKIA